MAKKLTPKQKVILLHHASENPGHGPYPERPNLMVRVTDDGSYRTMHYNFLRGIKLG